MRESSFFKPSTIEIYAFYNGVTLQNILLQDSLHNKPKERFLLFCSFISYNLSPTSHTDKIFFIVQKN